LDFTLGSDNGSAFVAHIVTCSSTTGAPTRTASALASPISVTSLENGHTYNCTVRSENAVGSSPASNTIVASSYVAGYTCPSGGSHIGGGTCQSTQYNYDWTCPQGGTRSGSWCANGYTASDSYGASLSCWGPSLDSTTGTNWSSSYSYPRTVNVGGYNACGGHIGYNNHRTQYASNGTPGCWSSTSLAAAFSTSNMIGCRSDRFVNIRYYRGGGHSYSCPSGGSLSGSTCYRSWWVDTSYSATWAHVSTSYPTYAATGTWNYSVT
jgi:hypothetical protein